jgi:hypothetical protein
MDMKKIRFFTQTGISVTVLGFCMGMLISGEKTEIYLPVLTGIVGYWLPQPSAKNDDVKRIETLKTQQMMNIERNIERNIAL